LNPRTVIGSSGYSEYKKGSYENEREAFDSSKHKTHTDFVNQIIDGYTFTKHALIRMQERGIYASQVIDAIKYGESKAYTNAKGDEKIKFRNISDAVLIVCYANSMHIGHVGRDVSDKEWYKTDK
jgi:hypothetical protein